MKPIIFFPFLLILIFKLVPSMSTLNQFILLGQGRWNFDILSANTLVGSLIYSLGFLIYVNKIKGASFPKLVNLGFILRAVGYIATILYIYTRYFPLWFLFTYKIFADMMYSLGGDLLFIPMVGKISKYLPEGFESTGITIAISFSNLTGISSGFTAKYEINHFKIKKGYYERTAGSIVLNSAINCVFILVSPFFLFRG